MQLANVITSCKVFHTTSLGYGKTSSEVNVAFFHKFSFLTTCFVLAYFVKVWCTLDSTVSNLGYDKILTFCNHTKQTIITHNNLGIICDCKKNAMI